jgi:hypothetical protein
MGQVMTLREALETLFTGEASFASYLLPGETKQPRLGKRREARKGIAWLAQMKIKPRMHWVPLDLDTPKHVPWTPELLQEWWPEQLQRLRSTPEGVTAGWYLSRAGARILWPLQTPLAPDDWERACVELRKRIRGVGVKVDELKDFTRLMRLPRIVLQDGTNLHGTTVDVSQMQPLSLILPAAPVQVGLRLATSDGETVKPESTPDYDDPFQRLGPDFPLPMYELLREGRALAPPPDKRGPNDPARNPEMIRIAGLVVAHMRHPDVDAALDIMRASVQAMEDEGATEEDGVSLDILEDRDWETP